MIVERQKSDNGIPNRLLLPQCEDAQAQDAATVHCGIGRDDLHGLYGNAISNNKIANS